jgi:2-phosphosulfolactate phosphatase
MIESAEVLFTPADFDALRQHDLHHTTCVVFDVLRATSSMVTALGNGAAGVIPVAHISEAVELRRQHPDILLGGERHGVRIRAEQSGGVDFDFGNSPREYTADKVRGRMIVSTTTNGTRALRACAPAQAVLIGSFLNLGVTAARIRELKPGRLLVVCSGTFEIAAYEDVLAAGALCELLQADLVPDGLADSCHVARQAYEAGRNDLLAAMRFSRNGRRLLSVPELADDVSFSLRRDAVPLVAARDAAGVVRAL